MNQEGGPSASELPSDLVTDLRALVSDATLYLRQREAIREPLFIMEADGALGAPMQASAERLAHSSDVDARTTAKTPDRTPRKDPPGPLETDVPTPQKDPPIDPPPLTDPGTPRPFRDPPAPDQPDAPIQTRTGSGTQSGSASGGGRSGLPEGRLDPARRAALQALEREVAVCTKCDLAATRTRPVFGVGSCTNGIMFIGEAPGADEDAQGEPFVGRAGQLLTKAIVQGMRLTRDDVYITNIVKSRPPANRVPTPEEAAACLPFLVKQIAILAPTVICALGLTAARYLLDKKGSLASFRGVKHFYHGIPVVVTYHPAAILRNPEYKRPFWEDLQTVMRIAGLSVAGTAESQAQARSRSRFDR
jgi:DNA polymerase